MQAWAARAALLSPESDLFRPEAKVKSCLPSFCAPFFSLLASHPNRSLIYSLICFSRALNFFLNLNSPLNSSHLGHHTRGRQFGPDCATISRLSRACKRAPPHSRAHTHSQALSFGCSFNKTGAGKIFKFHCRRQTLSVH